MNFERDQDAKSTSRSEMHVTSTVKQERENVKMWKRTPRKSYQPQTFDSQTKIAPCRDFVLKIRIEQPSEVVVQFTSTVSRIGFQILMNDYEVGDGLRIVNGGHGQVSGDAVCVEEGVLRVRWDNHYKGPKKSFESADVRYHITCRDIDDTLNLGDDGKYKMNHEENEVEPIGGFSNDSVPSNTTTTSSSDDERSNPGRDDDCVIQ